MSLSNDYKFEPVWFDDYQIEALATTFALLGSEMKIIDDFDEMDNYLAVKELLRENPLEPRTAIFLIKLMKLTSIDLDAVEN